MIYIILMIIMIVADQVSKLIAVENLKPIGSLPLINGVINFTYTDNTGAAFSIFRDKKMFLIIITSLAMIGLIIYLLKKIKQSKNILFNYSLVFVISGGIGNLIDRIRLGYVVDFIDFRLINFAIFNVADIFIVIGAGLLIIDTIFFSKKI